MVGEVVKERSRDEMRVNKKMTEKIRTMKNKTCEFRDAHRSTCT